MTKLTYRPDIDALRALAVMSVIFFHIKADLLPGGFLGVDIFFVISGYLITKIILGHEGPTRSFFPEFYERRIRRLIPPAIPVVIFSFVAGLIWLSAGQLESLSKSIIAYTGFVSNWLFLSEVNYFDVPAHYKPLLHTWSLSVEEQFYLLFPIIILALKKIHAKWVIAFYAVVFIASLALSYVFMFSGNNEAAFFNSFARFWEIALGGLLACGVLPSIKSKVMQEGMTAIGLLMIAASLFLVRETMDYNGLGSLAPTIGTAMVIHAKSQDREAQLIDWREKSQRTKCWIDHRESIKPAINKCISYSEQKPNVLLIGDSHAAHLLPGFTKNFPKTNFSLLAVDSCDLIKRTSKERPACNELTRWIETSDLSEFDIILLSSRNLEVNIPSQTIEILDKISSQSTLYYIGPIPHFEPNMPTLFPTLIGTISDTEIDKKFEAAMNPEIFEKDKAFEASFAEMPNITYVSMTDIICPQNQCKYRDPDGWPILIDNSHLSVEASEMFLSGFPIDLSNK